VLGIWIAAAEGARFWGGVLAELRNRGVKDVLIVCCDGLNGLPDAIEATWPKAIVQTCVIHLIRASMRLISYNDRKKLAAALRPLYTAVNEAAAKAALEQLRREHGRKCPGLIATWERSWDQFTPVPAVRPRHPQGHLHHQRHRIHQLPAPQDHQEPRPLPRRRRRDETALPRHPQHHRPPYRRHRPDPRPVANAAPAPTDGTAPSTPWPSASATGSASNQDHPQ
jgi:putative transposase